MSIIINPAIADVSVFLALSTALGSPPEVINLKPPTIRRTKRTIPAKPKARLTILSKRVPRSDIFAGST